MVGVFSTEKAAPFFTRCKVDESGRKKLHVLFFFFSQFSKIKLFIFEDTLQIYEFFLPSNY